MTTLSRWFGRFLPVGPCPHLPEAPVAGLSQPPPALSSAAPSAALAAATAGLSGTGAALDSRAYPVFTEPADYMACREGGHLLVHTKRFFERRAIRRCLDGLTDIRAVVDVPCGPGRLFPYWRRRGFVVTGMDFSMPMVAAATERHRDLGLQGRVLWGDAFRPETYPGEVPDLVASVRFVYYFGREQRVALLEALAAVSRRYVLAQYKTWETLRGRKTQGRTRRKHGANGKQFCSRAEIAEELQQASLTCLRIEPIGPWSDRVFVMAERASGARSA